MKRLIDRVRVPAQALDCWVPVPFGADLISCGFVGADLNLFFMADEGAGIGRVRLLVLPERIPVDLPDGVDLILVGRAEKQSTIALSGIRPTPLEVFHVFQIVSAPICD